MMEQMKKVTIHAIFLQSIERDSSHKIVPLQLDSAVTKWCPHDKPHCDSFPRNKAVLHENTALLDSVLNLQQRFVADFDLLMPRIKNSL